CPFPHVNPNNNRNNYNGSGRSTFGQVDINKRLRDFWDQSTLDRKSTEISEELRDFETFESLSSSAFGLADPAVENLISGRDYSFEESRLDFYQAQQANAVQDYEKMINIRTQDMKNCVDFLKKDTRKPARYTQVTTREKFEHPPTYAAKPFINFPLDLTGNSLSNNTQSPFGSSPFGGSSNTTSNPFGCTNIQSFWSVYSLGNSSSTGGGAFGSQSLGGTSAFGQSGFGSSAASTSPFGTANPLGSAFGSSGFGSATGPSFGGASLGSSNSKSAFGSSGFGQPSTTSTSPFGQQKPAATSAFGTSGFGTSNSTSSPFGSAGISTNKDQQSPFGAISTTGDKPSTSSAFGQGSISQSPFGQVEQKAASPFGQNSTISPFGQSAFGQSTVQPSSSSAFGQSGAIGQSPFGQSQNTAGLGSVSFGNAFGNFLQQPSGQSFTPTFKQSAKEEARSKEDELGDEVKAQFTASTFTIGLVPEVPPPLAYC
ncbi:unnamed protein product, partial [Wickerhamomyces anomalus]